MAKERYIKIDGIFYPIDSMCWLIVQDGRYVHGYRIGENDNYIVMVQGEDATNLIALLDEISFDLDSLREDVRG